MLRQVNKVALETLFLLCFIFIIQALGYNISKRAVVFSNFKDYTKLSDGVIATDNVARYLNPASQNTKIFPFIRYQFQERVKINQIVLYTPEKNPPKVINVKYGDVPYALKEFQRFKPDYKPYKVPGIRYATLDLAKMPATHYIFLEIVKPKDEIEISEIVVDTEQAIKKQVYNIRVVQVTDTTATIAWESNYFGMQTVLVGRDPEKLYAQTLGTTGEKHMQTITHLLPGNTYYFQIGMMGDTRGIMFTDIDSFVTTGLTPPEIVSIKPVPDKYKASLYIRTNIPVRLLADVYQGNKPLLQKYVVSEKFGTYFEFNIANLLPQTHYKARFYLIDEHKQLVRTRFYPFKTLENNIAIGQKIYGTFKPLKYIADGNNSALESMAKSGTLKRDNYFMIDFGKAVDFDTLVIQWRALAYPLEYYVMIGDGVINFPYVKKVSVPETLPLSRSRKGDPMKTVVTDISGASGRFLKLLVKANAPNYRKHKARDWLELLEVKVFQREVNQPEMENNKKERR